VATGGSKRKTTLEIIYLRDAKSYQIVEGSSNVQKMIIAQDALGVSEGESVKIKRATKNWSPLEALSKNFF
jgi:hypothetical protein